MGSKKDPIESYIAAQAAELRPILRAVRAFVHTTAPALREGVKMDVPWYRGKGDILYIAAYTRHVNLGFLRGAQLEDPDGLLEGTGKSLRHVKIRDASALDDPRLVALLRHAVEYDRIH